MDPLVEASDWQALSDRLADLADVDLATATTWYRRTGRAHARRKAERDWRTPSRAVQILLAVTLSETPQEASRNCRWGRHFAWQGDGQAGEAIADALIRRGPDWAATFVGLAAAAEFRGNSQRGVAEVVSLTSAAVAAFGMPVPTTETYVRGWVLLLSNAHVHAMAAERMTWSPFAFMTAVQGAAQPAYTLGSQLTLADCLAATPSATELLTAALATPNALNDWANFSEDGWRVEPTIREAVRTGVLERAPLVDGAFAALSRDDRASNQRVLGEVIKALDLTPAEVKARAALILHVLPTAHGSLTKLLLGLALAADLPDDELIELGTVILARPEKAQQATLVAYLARSASDAREVLLRIAADSEDATLAAKSRKLLGSVGGQEPGNEPISAAPSVTGLPAWSHEVDPYEPTPFRPYAVSEAGLDEARSDAATWSRATSEAAYLDLVVKLAHRDLARLREVVAEWPDPDSYSHVRTPYGLNTWVKTGNARRSYETTYTSYRHGGPDVGRIVERHTHVMEPQAHLLFTDRLVEETLLRLGPLKWLLSTPSHADGTLDVAVLADRVRLARAVGYGAYDLVQALLRLGPTDASDARLFEGLSLAPAESLDAAAKGGAAKGAVSRFRWFGRGRTEATDRDGVEVIRRWIKAGGWRARTVDFAAQERLSDGEGVAGAGAGSVAGASAGAGVAGASAGAGATGPAAGVVEPSASELRLPLPEWLLSLAGMADLCAPVGKDVGPRRFWNSYHPGPWLGVCPWDVEALAVMIAARNDQDSSSHAQELPVIVWSAGPIGPALHHHLARQLAHPRLDSRLLAARHTGQLADQGRLDPAILAERSLALFDRGALSLARAAQGWAELAALSSMSVVWPTWSAVLDAACRAPKKPAGLADLLRATRDHAPVVTGQLGASWVPESVRELAAERGASKAVVEARALVKAVGATGSTPGGES